MFILRTMGTRPAGPRPKPLDALQPAHIARTTGLALNTVKDRIARMVEEGIIAGYTAVPNLRHLDLQASALYLEFTSVAEKQAAVEEIRDWDGLLELNDFLGRGLCADLAFQNARDWQDKVGRLALLAKGREVREFYPWDAPPVTRPLSALDWRIVQALRRSPRAPAHEHARHAGVSARTVKRRLARMAEEGSIFVAPIVDPSKVDGLFIFALLIYLREGAGPRPMEELRQTFHDSLVYSFVPVSADLGHFDLLLFARSGAEVEALRRRAEDVDGVVRADAWMFRAFESVGPWLDRAIERAALRAQESDVARRIATT